MTRSNPTARRRIVATSLLVSLLLVLGASLLAGPASAKPNGDIVAVDDPGTGDLLFTSESCDAIVPGQIVDAFCSPAAPDGYTAYIWLHPSANAYETYYTGTLPVDLLDMPAGRYLVSGGPVPLSKQITLVCRVEDASGTLIDTFSAPGNGGIDLQIGYDRVYRCTMYTLPEGELPDELAPDFPTNGPVTLEITDYLCPAGTDPALNYFGLIGRCSPSPYRPRYEAHGNGNAFLGDPIGDGTVSFDLTGGSWTITNDYPTGDHPPIFFCNVRDELFQEPPRYAPFMTYTYAAGSGAVMALEQDMTWYCAAYHIPAAAGDGSDVAQITVTKHLCPEGTTAPTVAACAQTVNDVTFHLLYGTQTIVATRATDANGVVSFAGPENLGSFGLAEDVPAGFVVAPYAICSENGGVPTQYPVITGAVVDLGALTGGDTVDCHWFNIVSTSAVAAPSELEVATDLEILDLAPVDDAGQDEPQDDAGQDEPQEDAGTDAGRTGTPESDGMVPLEEGE